MTILGLDPGIERTGWGVISYHKSKPAAVDYGCIFTAKEKPLSERLAIIHSQITALCQKHTPIVVSLEDLFFSKNVKTAMVVAQARGVAMSAVALQSLSVVSYSPLVIKQTITGTGKADKLQMQKMIQLLLKLPSIPQPDDTADALAIALTHAYRYRIESLHL